MSAGEVNVSVDDAGVAELELNRVDRRNALSADLARSIANAAARLDDDPAVHVVILRSASPEFFSVGADLKERRELDEAGLMAARKRSVAATLALLGIAVPVVSAVRGIALGGGLELALTSDVIVADATAVLGLPETGIGIIPGGGGTQLLQRRVGIGRAAELILTGRRLTAEDAHQYGIVDVLAADAADAAREIAHLIASKSPTAQREAKAALRDGHGLPIDEALAIEDTHWRRSANSADYREGLAAFADKRSPRWPTPDNTPRSTHIRTGISS